MSLTKYIKNILSPKSKSNTEMEWQVNLSSTEMLGVLAVTKAASSDPKNKQEKILIPINLLTCLLSYFVVKSSS